MKKNNTRNNIETRKQGKQKRGEGNRTNGKTKTKATHNQKNTP